MAEVVAERRWGSGRHPTLQVRAHHNHEGSSTRRSVPDVTPPTLYHGHTSSSHSSSWTGWLPCDTACA